MWHYEPDVPDYVAYNSTLKAVEFFAIQEKEIRWLVTPQPEALARAPATSDTAGDQYVDSTVSKGCRLTAY